jgi:hypothetical protein
MTWSIQIDGHDDLAEEAKAAFENGLVGMAKQLVEDINSGAGITITRANATTNTTGSVDLTSDEPLPNSGTSDESEAVPVDEAEAAPEEPPAEAETDTE